MTVPATPAAGETPPSAVEAPVAPVVPAAPVAPPPAGEQPFLKDRLARERRSVLKSLGIKVDSDEDIDASIEAFKASKEDQKTQRADLAAKVVAHEAAIQKLSGAEAAVKVYAEMEFNALTDAQKSVVKAAAGDDPAQRLQVIAIMKATAPVAPVAEAPKPIAAPAQTAPAASAPEVASSAAPNVREEHQRLAKSNPLLAAAYLLQNRHEYYKQ